MTQQQPDLFTPDEREIAAEGLARARAALAGEPVEPLEEAARDRDEAMASVEHNAGEQWNDEAFDFLRRYLETHAEMHVDDLWEAGLPEPHDRRALGPVLKRAAAAGLMEQTGDFRKSVSSHLLPKPIWRSLIHRGGEG